MMPDRGETRPNGDEKSSNDVNGPTGHQASLNRSHSCFLINKPNLSTSLASNDTTPIQTRENHKDEDTDRISNQEADNETGDTASLSSPVTNKEESFFVFPSLPFHPWKLQPSDSIESLSETDIEKRYSVLSMCFKNDKQTLHVRLDRLKKQKEQAEMNAESEIKVLRDTINGLRYHYQDSNFLQMIGELESQIEFLQNSINFVGNSAELLGSVRQEMKVSHVVDTMFAHVDNLKRLREKDQTELEEVKRTLVSIQDTKELPGPRTSHITQRQESTRSERGIQNFRNSNIVRRHSSQPVGISSTSSASASVHFGESSSAPVTPAENTINSIDNLMIEEVSRESSDETNNLDTNSRQSFEEKHDEDYCEDDLICDDNLTYSQNSQSNYTSQTNNDEQDSLFSNKLFLILGSTIIFWISQIRENFPRVSISTLRHAASAILVLCAAFILGFVCILPNIPSSRASVA